MFYFILRIWAHKNFKSYSFLDFRIVGIPKKPFSARISYDKSYLTTFSLKKCMTAKFQLQYGSWKRQTNTPRQKCSSEDLKNAPSQFKSNLLSKLIGSSVFLGIFSSAQFASSRLISATTSLKQSILGPNQLKQVTSLFFKKVYTFSIKHHQFLSWYVILSQIYDQTKKSF